MSVIFVRGVRPLHLLVNVGTNAENGTTVDEDLGEEVKDGVVDDAGRRHEQCRESKEYAKGNEHDSRPFLE